MCEAATCPTCHKQTWRGCGVHLAAVFRSVHADARCDCSVGFIVQGTYYPPPAGTGKAREVVVERLEEWVDLGEEEEWVMVSIRTREASEWVWVND